MIPRIKMMTSRIKIITPRMKIITPRIKIIIVLLFVLKIFSLSLLLSSHTSPQLISFSLYISGQCRRSLTWSCPIPPHFPSTPVSLGWTGEVQRVLINRCGATDCLLILVWLGFLCVCVLVCFLFGFVVLFWLGKCLRGLVLFFVFVSVCCVYCYGFVHVLVAMIFFRLNKHSKLIKKCVCKFSWAS